MNLRYPKKEKKIKHSDNECYKLMIKEGSRNEKGFGRKNDNI